MISNLIEKLKNYFKSTNEKGKWALFILLSCFTFGGAVNYGIFGFLPAIPFIVGLFFLSTLGGWSFRVMGVIVFITSFSFYTLKHQHGRLFHPAFGKEMVVAKDLCLVRFNSMSMVSSMNKGKCSGAQFGSSIGAGVLSKGTVLKVKDVYVSNADFGEEYYMKFDTFLGEVNESQFNKKDPELVWKDGSPVTNSDLRRRIFFYPSMLMLWALIPWILTLQILSLF
jgi:hypothetical protein